MPVEESMGDATYGDGDTRQAFADAGRTLIPRVPGRPNRTHFPKEDFPIDLEAGSCTCPEGNVARRIVSFGTRTGPTGRTHRLKGFRFDGAVCGVCPLRSQCVARSSGFGRTVQRTRSRLYCSRPAPCSRVRPSPGTSAPGGGGAPAGAAGPAGNLPVSLLRACQDENTAVLGCHRGQPDPGGSQSRSARRYRRRFQSW